MKWIFWSGVGIVGYTYAGYLCWLWVRGRLRPRPVKRGCFQPQVSVVMVVRNEESVLERKLANLSQLDYPADRLEIVIISDGSTDGTDEILRAWSEKDARLRVLFSSERRGKASGLNDAMAVLAGEIVVFADARQEIEPEAVRLLVENFADPAVGCASGQLMLGDRSSGETARGMGLYWRIEKRIRELEALSGSGVGATGALYAVRRSLLVPLPSGTILDDVYVPMNVARQGGRVVFESRARAWDVPDLGAPREFSRKVRTLNGNYQLLQLAPWLLKGENPIRFEFISHKLLRLVVPFALVAILVASLFLSGPLYRAALVLQVLFYGLSALAMTRVISRGPLARAAQAASTFVILNTAAVVAFANFVVGRKGMWIR
jgi:poly-beta-1,6-N-acetyl-D-glucosamine synthase